MNKLGFKCQLTVAGMAGMILLSTQAGAQTPPAPAWASNLLPDLRAETAEAACITTWPQWEVVARWADKYGHGASGWNYSYYQGDATQGGCVALYWFPQVGPPTPGDTYVFYHVYLADTPPDPGSAPGTPDSPPDACDDLVYE